jgi:hypothetical protein
MQQLSAEVRRYFPPCWHWHHISDAFAHLRGEDATEDVGGSEFDTFPWL